MVQTRVAIPHISQLPLLPDVEIDSSLPEFTLDGKRPKKPLSGAVVIERLILHELNHRTGDKTLVDEIPQLSPEYQGFFAQHIEYAWAHAEWDAQFEHAQGLVPDLCRQALLDEPSEFIRASKDLAQKLYDNMSKTETIAPGDFVVVIFTQAASETRHIALLKLDPDKRKTRTFNKSNGKTQVHFSETKIFPDTTKLHKCALISPDADSPGGFAITLLDTQARITADPVAAFFYKGFLTTELLSSARHRTRVFIQASDSWISWHSNEFTPSELLAFYRARRQALSGYEVDIRQFVGSALGTHPELHDELAGRLIESIFPKSRPESPHFLVDPDVARQITQNVAIEIDGGGRIIVPAERFADIVHLATTRTSENKIQITIETQVFREVLGPTARKPNTLVVEGA